MHRVVQAAAVTVVLLAGTLLGGCNIVGPVAAVAAGPPKVEAMYTLANVPTVVFVDDRNNLVSPVTLRRVIAERASQEIMINELVTSTISPQDALLIASRSDRASNLLGIEDIGRAVGAQQVVYVSITEFKDTPDGYTPRPVAAAEVKVIDVANHQRVFPAGEVAAGWEVKTMGKPVDPSLYSSRASRLQIYEALAGQLGDEIAKVFYKHEYKEVGERMR
jgi:hypothetical protein